MNVIVVTMMYAQTLKGNCTGTHIFALIKTGRLKVYMYEGWMISSWPDP